MRFTRNIKLGIKSLLIHKLRSILTMLGMVFGVGSVVAMLAIGEGASRSALEAFRLLGTNNIILNSKEPAAQEGASSSTRSWANIYGLKYEDEIRIREQFQSVERVVPVRRVPVKARLGERQTEMGVVGTTPDWFELVQRSLIAGRTLTWEDLGSKAGVCVLTDHGAEKLLVTRNVLGQSIILDDKAFVVVGIVNNADTQGNTFQLPDKKTDVYIPLSTCRQRFGELITERSSGSRTREVVDLQQIIVQVKETGDVRPTAAGITAMLEHFHKKEDYEIEVPLALLEQQKAQARIWTFTLGAIAAISLIVGGIGIMNIMLATVTERTREIGIRRAIGAKRIQIVGQFMTETIVMSVIGGSIGILFGWLIAQVVPLFVDYPTFVPLYSVVLSLVVSTVVGMASGIYPAIRAAMLDPIVALRHE